VDMNGFPVDAFDKHTLTVGLKARNMSSLISIVLASDITMVDQ